MLVVFLLLLAWVQAQTAPTCSANMIGSQCQYSVNDPNVILLGNYYNFIYMAYYDTNGPDSGCSQCISDINAQVNNVQYQNSSKSFDIIKLNYFS